MDEKEKEEKLSPDYIKGFNDGYFIGKHEPELASQLQAVESTSDRVQGFKAGVLEITKEKNKAFYPSWLKENKKDMGLDKNSPDKDKGDFDKE